MGGRMVSKMRHFLLCALACAWVVQLSGQNPVVDSLTQLLTETPPDEDRVDLLNKLARRVAFTEYQSGLAYYSEAVDIAERIGYDSGYADASAGLGEVYALLGNYDKGMECTINGLEYYSRIRDTVGLARSYINIGLIHNHMKQFTSALESYATARDLYHAASDGRGEIVARHNEAVIYAELKDTARAIGLYRANLKQLEGTNYWNIFAASYNNIGNMFDKTAERDSAMLYFERALEYKFKQPRSGSIANTFNNMAEVMLANKQLKQASEYLEKSRPHVEASGIMARKITFLEIYADVEAQSGRADNAIDAYKTIVELKDSLYDADRNEQAAQLEAAYLSELQQEEIAVLNKEKQIQAAEKSTFKWIAIAVSVGFGLIVVVLILVAGRSRERRKANELLQQKTAEIERQQREIMFQNEALSVQNDRLEDLNREKDGLIGVVAHDIRAPLNRSAALADLIASVGPLTEEQERFIGMIRKVSEDGGRLIQDLLELNAYERKDARIYYDEVDMAEVLDTSIKGFATQADRKELKLHFETMPSCNPQAITDEKLISRIFDNLLSNAIKFSEPGKNIFVTLSGSNGTVEFGVKDEGPGISPEDQKKMFKKFQRLSARPTGGETSTGLGLSIIKTLVEKLDGEIVLQSDLGKGTEFRVRFPRVPEGAV